MNILENKENRPTKEGFKAGLSLIGEKYENVIVLGADITASTGADEFASRFPERFFSFGIAEQNIASVAAGLALSNKIPIFSNYAAFAALRAADQVRVSICYNNLHVIIGGAHAGISVGPDGATHQALEDIAYIRALPNMTLLSPCDATQTKLAVIAAVEDIKGPVYIRYGRESVPDFTSPDMAFNVGKGQILNEGNDITIVATGHLVWESLSAAKILQTEGISARVVNIHTIKPLDDKLIIESAKKTKAVVTAEEHQINGGLGGAICECLCKNYPVPVEMIAVNDMFGESGQPSELMHKYGLSAMHIVEAVKKAIIRKRN